MDLVWLDHPGWEGHDTGPGHPERSVRYRTVREALAKAGYIPTPASPAKRDALLRLHPETYIDRVMQTCARGPAFMDSGDTVVSTESYDAAIHAAGAAMEGARLALDGTPVFAGVRPPGHHAEKKNAMGFCLFNNAALAALEARALGAERVAIFDFDVHHGNGTQHAFEEDPSVLYISTHQWPFYPGTGAKDETGIGDGDGSILNVPLKQGDGENIFRQALTDAVEPALKAFAPDLLIFSAGFDAHERDPLGGIRLSSSFFGEITERALAAAFSGGSAKVLSLLEGGYDLLALDESVPFHVKALN